MAQPHEFAAYPMDWLEFADELEYLGHWATDVIRRAVAQCNRYTYGRETVVRLVLDRRIKGHYKLSWSPDWACKSLLSLTFLRRKWAIDQWDWSAMPSHKWPNSEVYFQPKEN